LNQNGQPQLVSVFTTELFAYYLHIKYLSATKCHRLLTDKLKRYGLYISDTQQLFIGDVLLFLPQSRLLKLRQKPVCPRRQHTLMNANKHNTSDLVELLQKSAVEHLTTYRQLMARDFGSVATIVITDFEAMYAYKRGDYQRCLQLSTQNMHTLLSARGIIDVQTMSYVVRMPNVQTFPEFIQLLDDDIVSLTALMLIVNPKCRGCSDNINVTQLTLSLYLMTQCQSKLHHSVKSLARILDYIKVAQRRLSAEATLELLALKMIKRKIVVHIEQL